MVICVRGRTSILIWWTREAAEDIGQALKTNKRTSCLVRFAGTLPSRRPSPTGGAADADARRSCVAAAPQGSVSSAEFGSAVTQAMCDVTHEHTMFVQ